jgi:hypothetical protein
MESLGYVLIYLLRGQLPWQNIASEPETNTIDHHKRIGEAKCQTSLDALCDGLPEEFYDYFEHCCELKFAEQPNYDYLRELFRKIGRDRSISVSC